MFWGKKKPPPPPDPYLELQPRLLELLEGHGVSCATYKHWILPNNALPALRAFPYRTDQHESGRTTRQINIELKLSEEETIVECYGGMGSSLEQAIGDVLKTFCIGTMHVYLSAFWDKHEPDQVEIETWEINGARWSAYIGNTIQKRNTQIPQKLLPEGYLKTVQQHVASLPLGREYHWLSAYLFRIRDSITADMQIDNEPSPDLTSKMKVLAWPHSEGFYSTRMFILLKRLSDA
jgi:hypothetical protein